MFQLRQQQHSMKLRKSEKYEVKHAKKQRLKQSAIPAMQRMLNDNDKIMKA